MRNLVPYFILDNYNKRQFKGEFHAACIFADLKGFTRMTETLMQYGKVGAELLANTLSQVFTILVEMVYEHGGFISGYNGDAFTAIFTGINSKISAFTAAQLMQEYLKENSIVETKLGRFEFAFKIGLAYGDVQWGIINLNEKLEKNTYYFKGSAIDNCVFAESLASPYEIIVDKFIKKEISEFSKTELKDGIFFVVLSSTKPLIKHKNLKSRKNDSINQLPFISPQILNLSIKGEFRRVLTLFLHIKLDEGNHENLIEFMQTIFQLLQKYKGNFINLDFGDKGCTVLIFWGAPLKYENEIELALNFVIDLEARGIIPFSAGITYRRMYAGFYGTQLQDTFTCIGTGVNLAARQMMVGASSDILLDEAVAKRANQRFIVEFHRKFNFKGFKQKMPTYILKGRKIENDSIAYEGTLVGRNDELLQIKEFIQPLFSLSEKIFPRILTIYGEPGIGKSHLVFEFSKRFVSKEQVYWLFLPSERIAQTSLKPFKVFLKTFFNQHSDRSLKENKLNFENKLNEVFNLFYKRKGFSDNSKELVKNIEFRIPILTYLLDHKGADELVSHYKPEMKFNNIVSVIKNLIKILSQIKPVIIFIDDLQWFDDDSFKIFSKITYNINNFPTAIICTSRYLDGNRKVSLPVDEKIPQTNIALDYMSKQHIKAIVEDAVDGNIDEKLSQFIFEKSKGNPFFAEQLTLDLKERMLLEKASEGYFITNTKKSEVPPMINDILISRLDRLNEPVKKVVLTASVLGQEFETTLLEKMLENDPLIKNKIKIAVNAAIWRSISSINYIFKHALMRDAAYGMQLNSDLIYLHEQAAQSIIKTYPEELSSRYTILAYHFKKAENIPKMLYYTEKAGDYAKDNFFNDKSIEYYDYLIKYYYSIENSYLDKIRLLEKFSIVIDLKCNWEIEKEIQFEIINIAQKLKNDISLAEALLRIGNIESHKTAYKITLFYYFKALSIFKHRNAELNIARVLSNIGVIYYFQENYNDALKMYEKSLGIFNKLDDKLMKSVVIGNIGVIYKIIGKHVEAKKYFKQQLMIDVENNNELGIIKARGNIANLEQKMGDLKNSRILHKKNIALCQKIGDLNSMGIEYLNLAFSYELLDEYDNSEEYYKKYWELIKEMKHYYEISSSFYFLARLYISNNKLNKALDFVNDAYGYVKFINNDSFLYKILISKAIIFYFQGNILQSQSIINEIDNLQKFSKENFLDYLYYVLIARINNVLGKKSNAINLLKKIIKKAPDDEKGIYFYELWKITKDEEHYQLALMHIKEIYKSQPSFANKRKMDALLSKIVINDPF